MEQIVLTSETADLVLERLNQIIQWPFTIEVGHSNEDLDPIQAAKKIYWPDEKCTFTPRQARKGSEPDFEMILLSKMPSISFVVFVKDSSVFLSPNQIIFRSPGRTKRSSGKFLYHKIAIAVDNGIN